MSNLGQRGAIERMLTSIRMDGWVNLFTGLGTALRDKTTASRFVVSSSLSPDELSSMYEGNDLAARICDVVPDEMMRAGFDLTAEGSTKESDVLRRYDELEAHTRIVEAMTWGRVYGGGAIYLGIEDGLAESEPIDIARVKRLDFLTALDRHELQIEGYYDDPHAAKFGQAKLYRLVTHHAISQTGASVSREHELVHESRLIVFGGARTTNRRRRELVGWDESVLQRVNAVLQQFGTTWDGIAHLMSDIAQAVYKMKGLAEYMASNDDALVSKRLETIELGRSVVRAIVLDAESEDFERKPTPLTGVPDVMQLFVLRLSAAARMPATIMFSQSPAGLNATGESDLRWFYDTVEAERRNRLKPRLMQLFRVLWAEQGGEPSSWDITFRPAWSPTAAEASKMRLEQAQADRIYLETDVVQPEEIALSRFGSHGWSPETIIDVSARKSMLKAVLERIEEEAENPPPPPPMLAPGAAPPDPSAPPVDPLEDEPGDE